MARPTAKPIVYAPARMSSSRTSVPGTVEDSHDMTPASTMPVTTTVQRERSVTAGLPHLVDVLRDLVREGARLRAQPPRVVQRAGGIAGLKLIERVELRGLDL